MVNIQKRYHCIYHYVSPKHLHRYTTEFGYRYNNRQDCGRYKLELAVTRAANIRLYYAKLIGTNTYLPFKPTIETKQEDSFLENINPASFMSIWIILIPQLRSYCKYQIGVLYCGSTNPLQWLQLLTSMAHQPLNANVDHGLITGRNSQTKPLLIVVRNPALKKS